MYTLLRFILQVSESLGPDPGSMGVPLHEMGPLAEPQSRYFKSISDDIPRQLTSRILIEKRTQSNVKTLTGVIVYILHLLLPSPFLPSRILQEQIVAELQAHLVALRANPRSRLFVTVPLISETNNADIEAVSVACLRDLSLRQLSNDHATSMTEFLRLLDKIGDSTGRLVLIDKLHAPNAVTVAFELIYQGYARNEV